MANTNRYALGFSYLGTSYVGFQSQKTGNSVQEKIENAIATVANHPIKVICAGRTDKGVHALMQVVHFDSDSIRSNEQWLRGINANLPNDIMALWVKDMNPDFHARFSAISRSYVYLLNTQSKDLMMSQYSWYVKDLDLKKMEEAFQYCLGEQDFYAFQSRHCQSDHSIRNVEAISIERKGKMLHFHIKANAFLHHMVRKMVATFVKVGEGRLSPEDVKNIMSTKDRDGVPGQAPAKGLFLKQVDYANPWDIKAIGISQLLGE